MSSEFDAVRERLAYLRDHPDLDSLEPQVLELAAQMSHQSRELSDIYNDEKVTRAKTFLKQRQEEAERQQDLIVPLDIRLAKNPPTSCPCPRNQRPNNPWTGSVTFSLGFSSLSFGPYTVSFG